MINVLINYCTAYSVNFYHASRMVRATSLHYDRAILIANASRILVKYHYITNTIVHFHTKLFY